MTTPEIKGFCPGALRPMQSGDGIVVRIRPFNGRLRRAQADGIATLAAAHGNGMIDLSSRGNIQIRGVTEESYAGLIEGLRRMSLLDATPEIESRRNILVTPFWQTGDETEALAAALTDEMVAEGAPQVPHKFGFAVDTGKLPVLQTASADIRLERDAGGGLILVPDGSTSGKPVTSETVIAQALDLAKWFLKNRDSYSRMNQVIADGATLPPGYFVPRQAQTYVPAPGYTPLGAIVGLAFGQLPVETLAGLAKQGGLRMTPWRMILVESARNLPDVDGVITDPADPLLRVVACTGAPACSQGLAETRSVASEIAPHLGVDQMLHVSGCAKGCAHPKPAPLTVTATAHGYDLIRNGRASDPADQTGLTLQDIIKAL
ncbi:Precorrin-3B synthase [Sulfitobacter noctilucicola]|uniref:Precorrin-3B synthase n=1 Tax=Sulfitobacter noctilucicola TaxID=1342301 RepID=A0A7W6Q2V7_9RHOB|nr:precorrin-3B synthase [Sulfitobacter noctilucicola]KIN63024.1 Precorrin-3B synthase [Sulfitobacter noctilucicola]MBB4172449.1 precorrin-3B synthase [Sulfitobacter noctilucicola]